MEEKKIFGFRLFGESSKLFLENLVSRFSGDLPYWVAAFLTGVVAVGYAKIFDMAERFSQGLILNHPYYLLIASPFFFLSSWALVHYLSPEAKGSGIPQVMAVIEIGEIEKKSELLERFVGLRALSVKIVSSAFCVLGAGAVGREGPTIQISASLFHFVNQVSKRFSLKVNYHFGLIAGGAAGIAAAFNTPLGGLVFAIEELATSHFNKFKTSLISGVIISGLVAQWLTGSY